MIGWGPIALVLSGRFPTADICFVSLVPISDSFYQLNASITAAGPACGLRAFRCPG